jgi:5-methylcytosine-specific restriction endonuclease McrA
MADVLNARIVLRLNANWQRIGFSTVAEAFTALTGGDQKNPPALALDIEYELDENGKPNYDVISYAQPKTWEEWLQVPIRSEDIAIGTVRQKIRVPTVIICPKFTKMPIKKLRPTKQGIRERDKNKCQYTGKELTNKTASLDHILPRSKGGGDSWENLVLCHKDVNCKKGNRLNEEIGLKLLSKPAAPKPIPVCELIRDIKHPDHSHF